MRKTQITFDYLRLALVVLVRLVCLPYVFIDEVRWAYRFHLISPWLHGARGARCAWDEALAYWRAGCDLIRGVNPSTPYTPHTPRTPIIRDGHKLDR